MNYQKQNKVGVDVPIERIKDIMYNKLVSKWGVSDLDVYGRVYKNKRSKKQIPEYYVGGNEYKSVLLDDRKTGIIFFNIKDNISTNGGNLSVGCEIIVTVNLNTLNGNNERTDANIQADVFNCLNTHHGILSLDDIIVGVENVYNEFRGVSDYFIDMQEFHHFKISGTINYSNNNC